MKWFSVKLRTWNCLQTSEPLLIIMNFLANKFWRSFSLDENRPQLSPMACHERWKTVGTIQHFSLDSRPMQHIMVFYSRKSSILQNQKTTTTRRYRMQGTKCLQTIRVLQRSVWSNLPIFFKLVFYRCMYTTEWFTSSIGRWRMVIMELLVRLYCHLRPWCPNTSTTMQQPFVWLLF